jgi:hypothetical protein
MEHDIFNNTCYEGRTPDAGEIIDDVKEECGDLEVRFIKASECPKGIKPC